MVMTRRAFLASTLITALTPPTTTALGAGMDIENYHEPIHIGGGLFIYTGIIRFPAEGGHPKVYTNVSHASIGVTGATFEDDGVHIKMANPEGVSSLSIGVGVTQGDETLTGQRGIVGGPTGGSGGEFTVRFYSAKLNRDLDFANVADRWLLRGDYCNLWFLGLRLFPGYVDPQALAPVTTDGVVPTGGDVDRIAGSNRWETGVEVSKVAYPNGAPVVYLANGEKPFDALVAKSLTGGPILLVPTGDTVPQAVLDEVARLRPARVRPVGGDTAVSTVQHARCQMAAGI